MNSIFSKTKEMLRGLFTICCWVWYKKDNDITNLAGSSGIDSVSIIINNPISMGSRVFSNKGVDNYIILLLLYEGEYDGQYFPGADFGSNWLGKYQLAIIDTTNNKPVCTYKLKEWDELLNFHNKFELSLTGYNDDGTLELFKGQYGTSNYNRYRMYYITEELKIGYYESVGEITMSNLSLSPTLMKDKTKALTYSYYDNTKGKDVEKVIGLELLTIPQ